MSRPLQVAAFRRLLLSYGLNEVGWGLGTVALAVLVYARTSSALATTGLFLASTFVPAVLAPAITATIDRLARARVLAGLYAAEALVFTLLALTATHVALPVVFGLAMLDGTLALAGRALTRASVASALDPASELRAGNALLNVVWSVGSIAGPALGGAVVAVAGTSASLGGAAIVFTLMTLLLLGARTLPLGSDRDEPWKDRMREALAYIAGRPPVRRLVAGQVCVLAVCTLAVPIEVVYAKESLRAGDGAYGVLLAAWGAGMVCGSIVFARAENRSLRSMIIGSLAAVAVSYAIMTGARTVSVAALGCVLGGLGNGISAVAMVQALQQGVEERLQARVMSLWEGIGAASIGIGYLLGGAIAALSSPRVVFAVAAISISGVAMALSGTLPGEPPAVPDVGAEGGAEGSSARKRTQAPATEPVREPIVAARSGHRPVAQSPR